METPAQAMEAALPAPAPTAPTEGAGDAATQPTAGITPVVDPTITQSTPIGPNLSLQSLQDGTYRLVSENSTQVIDKTICMIPSTNNTLPSALDLLIAS